MQVSRRLLALPLTQLARKAAVAAIALMGVTTIMWSFAQNQVTPEPVPSSLSMGGQVVAPATSPTINSSFSISGNDEVKWITYLQSRVEAPFEAIGESVFKEANSPSTNFKWIKGKLVLPPKTNFEWFVNGSGWTATEPDTGKVVTKVRWKSRPMVVVNFGVVDPTVDFTGTGDGFRIIPYKDRLFVVNHHSTSGYLNCRMAKTGLLCPGFPTNGAGYSFVASSGAPLNSNGTYRTSHAPLEAMNLDTGELFVAIHKYGTNEIKVLCTDLSKPDQPKSCGEFPLGIGAPNPEENVANLAYFQNSGRYYSWLSSGTLACFNVKTKADCGSKKINLDSWSPSRGMVHVAATQMDDKFFFATPVRVRCFDSAKNETCSGWPDTGFSSATGVYPYLEVDKFGRGIPKGVCDSRGNYCRDIAGNPFVATPNFRNFVAANAFVSRDNPNWGPDGYVRATYAGAYVGTRIYTSPSDVSKGGVSCFDFQTDKACQTYSPGTVTEGYSTYVDPTRPGCVLHLGHNSRGLLFNALDYGPCTDGTGADQPKLIDITPADYYRCDATQSTVREWDKVRISSSIPWNTPGGLKSVKVTLQDANGVELPPLYKPVRQFDPGKYSLSIADVPYEQYKRLKVVVQMTGQGGLSSTSDLGMDVTWKGDPIQLCFHTQAPIDPGCPTSVDTTVTLAKFENPDNVFDGDPLTAIKSLWPGVPNTGYAAVSAATSPRSVLSDAVAGKAGLTRVLQGRYDMQTYTGDLWAFYLDEDGNVDVDAKPQKASVLMAKDRSRSVYSAQPRSGRPGSMEAYKLGLAEASLAQRTALNTSVKGVLDNRGNDRVNYLYGIDGTFRARNSDGGNKLGPVVSSGPVVLNRNTMPSLPENLFKGYTEYRKNSIKNKVAPLALWGGNDGTLHAFTFAANGDLTEAWAFVSDVMLKRTNFLTDSSLAEALSPQYYVDAIPMIGHAFLQGWTNNGWAPVAVTTYGRGARAITALDISSLDLSKGNGVLFEYTNSTLGDTTRSEGVNDLADLGRIISQPAFDESLGSHQIVRLNDGGKQRWAVLVGNGVESNDGVGGTPSGTGRPVLYAFYLDEFAGLPRWRRIDVQSVAGLPATDAIVTKNGLSTPRPVDTDGNGDVDLAYAGDIQGNLWRFDLSNMSKPGVTKLFETIGKQPIYTVPVAVRNTVQGACATDKLRQCWQITFGSGHHFSPIKLDLDDNLPVQHLYGLLDKGDKKQVPDKELVANEFETPAQKPGDVNFRTVSAQKIDYAAGIYKGWYIALGPNEHLVGATKLQPTGLAMYPVVQPGKKSSASASCAPAQSWLFELNPMTGAPSGYTFDVNGDGFINSADLLGSGGKTPAAMAISGNQFGPPAILLDSSTGANSMSLVFPSVGQDQSAPNSFGSVGPKKGQPNNAKHANPKQLGRMSWREVY